MTDKRLIELAKQAGGMLYIEEKSTGLDGIAFPSKKEWREFARLVANEKLEEAAMKFEKMAEGYAIKYSHNDMGVLSFGLGVCGQIKMDYYNSLHGHAEMLRAMKDEA